MLAPKEIEAAIGTEKARADLERRIEKPNSP
jgi:hypothetical protein